MLKWQHQDDQMSARVRFFCKGQIMTSSGAFSGGEIFGIIVGTFALVGMLYVSYNKRYDIEYFVSSYMPSTSGFVVNFMLESSNYSFTMWQKAPNAFEPNGVNIPTQLDSNQVESDQGLYTQIRLDIRYRLYHTDFTLQLVIYKVSIILKSR